MIYVLISVICSTWLIISFKIFQRYNLDTFQVIIFNYFACVATVWVTEGEFPIKASLLHNPWFPIILGIGLSFIVAFNLAALTITYISATIGTVMQKMSMLMTILFTIFWYHESIGVNKIIGIILAIIAIILTNKLDKNTVKRQETGRYWWLLPIFTLITCGFVDIGILFAGRTISNGKADPFLTAAIFGIAGIIGITIFIVGIISRRIVFDYRNIIGGIVLGVPNYFSLYFLLKALSMGIEGSVIFPIINMSVIIMSALIAMIFFKEKLSLVNWLGVALSVLAIIMIAFDSLIVN